MKPSLLLSLTLLLTGPAVAQDDVPAPVDTPPPATEKVATPEKKVIPQKPVPAETDARAGTSARPDVATDPLDVTSGTKVVPKKGKNQKARTAPTKISHPVVIRKGKKATVRVSRATDLKHVAELLAGLEKEGLDVQIEIASNPNRPTAAVASPVIDKPRAGKKVTALAGTTSPAVDVSESILEQEGLDFDVALDLEASVPGEAPARKRVVRTTVLRGPEGGTPKSRGVIVLDAEGGTGKLRITRAGGDGADVLELTATEIQIADDSLVDSGGGGRPSPSGGFGGDDLFGNVVESVDAEGFAEEAGLGSGSGSGKKSRTRGRSGRGSGGAESPAGLNLGEGSSSGFGGGGLDSSNAYGDDLGFGGNSSRGSRGAGSPAETNAFGDSSGFPGGSPDDEIYSGEAGGGPTDLGSGSGYGPGAGGGSPSSDQRIAQLERKVEQLLAELQSLREDGSPRYRVLPNSSMRLPNIRQSNPGLPGGDEEDPDPAEKPRRGNSVRKYTEPVPTSPFAPDVKPRRGGKNTPLRPPVIRGIPAPSTGVDEPSAPAPRLPGAPPPVRVPSRPTPDLAPAVPAEPGPFSRPRPPRPIHPPGDPAAPRAYQNPFSPVPPAGSSRDPRTRNDSRPGTPPGGRSYYYHRNETAPVARGGNPVVLRELSRLRQEVREIRELLEKALPRRSRR